MGAVRISNCTLASNCKVWKAYCEKKGLLTCFLTVTYISTNNVKKIVFFFAMYVCIFMCCIIYYVYL